MWKLTAAVPATECNVTVLLRSHMLVCKVQKRQWYIGDFVLGFNLQWVLAWVFVVDQNFVGISGVVSSVTLSCHHLGIHMTCHRACYCENMSHPQNWKYIKYCNATKRGPSYGQAHVFDVPTLLYICCSSLLFLGNSASNGITTTTRLQRFYMENKQLT